MIRFLAPLFLAGLAAALIPLVLHLLHRRRVPVVPFPLVRLLSRIERTRQPRRRLNRVLLLSARILFLALLALALARTLLGGGEAAVASEGPVAVAVVVDDSLSVASRAESGRSVLEEGLARAADFLARLPDGSMVAVVRASAPEVGERAGFLGDADEARRLLLATAPTLRRLSLEPALAAAARLLAGAPLQERRAVLVSDLARHAIGGGGVEAAFESPVPLQVFAPDRPAGDVNASVTGLDVRSLPDGRARVSVRAAAWGQVPEGGRDTPVEVLAGPLGGELRLVARTALAPGSGASVERVIDVVLPDSGPVRVVARLAPDGLPADDVREAAHHAKRRPRVLVVDGDPQNIALGSETFYLEKALAPGVGLDVEAEVVTLAELTSADLEGQAAIVLCNVPELSDDRFAAALSAVEAGAGLVVSLGDRVDQRAWNGRLARLLPARLSGPVPSAPPLSVEPGGQPLDLPRVAVKQHFVLEPEPAATVLARLSDGSPLAVAGTVGAGRSVLLATTLDRDWSDLPINPRYLAFVRGLLDEALGRREGLVLAPLQVGEPRDLTPVLGDATGRGDCLLRRPDGTSEPLGRDGVIRGLEQAGVHAIEAEDGTVLGLLPVVTDPIESDLTRVPEVEFAELLLPAFALVGSAAGGEAGAAGGFPAWKAFLASLSILAMAEAWLARKAA